MERLERVDLSIFVGKLNTLCEYLQSNPNVDLTRLRDEKKNSVLHITAYENKFELMRVIIDHVEKVGKKINRDGNIKFPAEEAPIKQIIQDLINDKNVQGFTALHYASLRGNYSMMRFLEQRGGSVLTVNKSRLNIIHCAAQGDAIASILYLQSRFKNHFNDKDYSESTALHWASYFGSQNVVEFLLAQPEILIDQKDIDGHTPLHIAVLNGRPAIVRRLLIKGASRKLTNKKQQTPMQIAQRLQYSSIIKMLNDQYTCSDSCMFYYSKKRKYQPQFLSCCKPIVFMFLFIFVVGSTHLLYDWKIPILYTYITTGIHFFILLLYLTLLIRAPVKIRQPYKELIDHLPVCSECKTHRDSRVYHCNICQRCVSEYDHHCPWINGCVGKHNSIRFILFLVMLLLAMIFNAILEIVGIFQLQFLFEEYRYFGMHEELHKYFQIAYQVTFGIGLGTVFVFFILSLGLLCNQVKNICDNTTAYERSFQGYRRITHQPNLAEN